MAHHLTEAFGTRLHTPAADGADESPHALLGKVVVKGKRVVGTDARWSLPGALAAPAPTHLPKI